MEAMNITPTYDPNWGIFKADLDATTLTYDCRMQLAHIIHTTRIASCKSTSQLPQDCRIQFEKSGSILKHAENPATIARKSWLVQVAS